GQDGCPSVVVVERAVHQHQRLAATAAPPAQHGAVGPFQRAGHLGPQPVLVHPALPRRAHVVHNCLTSANATSATRSSTAPEPAEGSWARGQCTTMSVNPSLLARRAASVNVSTDDSAEVGPLSSINKRAAASGSRPAAASASVNCSDSVATPRHHESWSSPPLPVVIQPWPNRAASASDRGPLAASANGTRGCCTLP